MDATPINRDTAIPLDAAGQQDRIHAEAVITARWMALHDAAAIVAGLAGIADTGGSDLESFPAALAKGSPERRMWAEQALDDLAAIMEPGIAALLAVHTAGGNPTAPARALWHEFVAARDALFRLVLPLG